MRCNTVPKTAAVIAAACLFASLALAAGQKDKSKPKEGGTATGTRVAVDVFLDHDREVIRRHFAGTGTGLPPGLAKRNGSLPPGLEKQLRRNGRLPPGLEKKVAPFPVELERRLPPLKSGLRRGMIEGHAVIFGKSSSVILDVFTVF